MNERVLPLRLVLSSCGDSRCSLRYYVTAATGLLRINERAYCPLCGHYDPVLSSQCVSLWSPLLLSKELAKALSGDLTAQESVSFNLTPEAWSARGHECEPVPSPTHRVFDRSSNRPLLYEYLYSYVCGPDAMLCQTHTPTTQRVRCPICREWHDLHLLCRLVASKSPSRVLDRKKETQISGG